MNKLKKCFNNRPWKEVKTRKLTLIFTILFIIIYTSIGLLMGWYDHSLDSTLTNNVFNYCKWLVITGCVITVTKVLKGKTNSDQDELMCCEDYVEEELEEEEE